MRAPHLKLSRRCRSSTGLSDAVMLCARVTATVPIDCPAHRPCGPAGDGRRPSLRAGDTHRAARPAPALQRGAVSVRRPREPGWSARAWAMRRAPPGRRLDWLLPSATHRALAGLAIIMIVSAATASTGRAAALKFSLRSLGGIALFWASADLLAAPGAVARAAGRARRGRRRGRAADGRGAPGARRRNHAAPVPRADVPVLRVAARERSVPVPEHRGDVPGGVAAALAGGGGLARWPASRAHRPHGARRRFDLLCAPADVQSGRDRDGAARADGAGRLGGASRAAASRIGAHAGDWGSPPSRCPFSRGSLCWRCGCRCGSRDRGIALPSGPCRTRTHRRCPDACVPARWPGSGCRCATTAPSCGQAKGSTSSP